jgi:hypothetical protein
MAISHFKCFGRAALLLLPLVFLCSSCSNKNEEKKHIVRDTANTEKKPGADNHEEKNKEDKSDTLYTITIVGDVMMGTNYPDSYALPPDDGKYLFDDVAEYLSDADVTIGNLEGTLLNSGGTPKQCIDPAHCIAFRMPEHYAGYLKNAGFVIMGVGNNHSGDMGEEGRTSTMNTLKKYGIKYAGYTRCPTTVFVKDGIRFGFTAFAPNSGTQDLNDMDAAIESVSGLRKQCDILIVSFHGGAEGSDRTRVTRKREYYLDEDRGNVYEFAHAMIDAGADIVFGQGPHVPRALELYNDKIIDYSLGNFCTYGKFGLGGTLGLAPILKVYIDKNGDFAKGRIIAAKQIKRGIPVMDEDGNVIKLIKQLTEKDFPETKLVIGDDGYIETRE